MSERYRKAKPTSMDILPPRAADQTLFDEVIVFEKNTGDTKTVRILDAKKINQGAIGEIFDTVTEVGGRKKRFIIKKFFDPETRDGPYNPAIGPERTFENYNVCKRAGLKVFPTYRISQDKKSILMTNAFSDEWVCIGSNQEDSSINLETFSETKFTEIANFEVFLDSVFGEAIKAAAQDITLPTDCYFFLIQRETSHAAKVLDFVLGDLDQITLGKVASKEREIFLNNITALTFSIQAFLNTNAATKDCAELYTQRLQAYAARTARDSYQAYIELRRHTAR